MRISASSSASSSHWSFKKLSQRAATFGALVTVGLATHINLKKSPFPDFNSHGSPDPHTLVSQADGTEGNKPSPPRGSDRRQVLPNLPEVSMAGAYPSPSQQLASLFG